MSRVALATSTFRSDLNLAMSLIRPNRMSVWSVRSWASSMMTTLVGETDRLTDTLAFPSKKMMTLDVILLSLPVAGQVRLGEKLSEQHAVRHVLQHRPL